MCTALNDGAPDVRGVWDMPEAKKWWLPCPTAQPARARAGMPIDKMGDVSAQPRTLIGHRDPECREPPRNLTWTEPPLSHFPRALCGCNNKVSLAAVIASVFGLSRRLSRKGRWRFPIGLRFGLGLKAADQARNAYSGGWSFAR